MQKKSLISILSVTMALIVASLALVFTVGPMVHANDEIGKLDREEYFEIQELDDGLMVLRGLTEEGWNIVYNYEYVDVIVPDGVNIVCGHEGVAPRSLDNRTYYEVVFPYNTYSVSLPDTVIEIGNRAFNGCDCLTTVNFAEDSELETIGHRAFSGCSNLTQIEIPDTVTEIGDDAFSGCSSLTQINIPDSVTAINDYTFADCSNLQSVKLPDNLEHIGHGAFSNCQNLTQIEIPDTVTEIGNCAFQNCDNLQSVKLPDNLEYIGEYAFSECYDLRTFIPDTVETIGYAAFDGCNNTIYCAAENQPNDWNIDWRYTQEVEYDSPAGPVFNRPMTMWNCELSDCLVYKYDNNNDNYTIVGYVGNFEDKNLVLPKTYNTKPVAKIGEGAFEGIIATSIIVPDSITEIEGFAFTNCNVETIMISDTVATMGKAVFDGGNIHNIYFEIAEDAIPANWDEEWDYHLENCGYYNDSGDPYERPIWIATNVEYDHEIVEPEPQTPTDPNQGNENQNTESQTPTDPNENNNQENNGTENQNQASEQPANNEQPENKVNVAAIAGGTAGGVAGLGTIGTIIGLAIRKKRHK